MESRPIPAPVEEVLRPPNPAVPHARTKDDHAVLTFGAKGARGSGATLAIRHGSSAMLTPA